MMVRSGNQPSTDTDEIEDESSTEEDFFQIENYYELTFAKNATNAKLIKPNDPNIIKLGIELVNSFRQLINAYVKNNNWTKFFDLVDSVDADLFKKCTGSKQLSLGQDEMYRILGDVFFKLDYNVNALEFYRKSLRLSTENNLLALESYENLLNLSIERWHYRMVNDKVRNSAYSRAIRAKLEVFQEKNSNVKVFDVGAGTGLLSALCLDHKIDLDMENFKLFACEQSELFYKISEKFLGSFNMNRLLKLFNKNSRDLNKNEDLPVIDLIVTEIFDDGLLGEGCLNTFYNLLFEKSILNIDRSLGVSRIIPQSAKIYIAAIECEFLHTSNYFRHTFRFNNQTIEIRACCLDNSDKFENNPNSNLNYEPYTTDNLNQVDFSFLSEPVELKDLFIRFDDKAMLEKLCKREEVISVKQNLDIKSDGAFDACILWFDLNLDSKISITNSPTNNTFNPTKAEISDCWQHAIYNVANDCYVRRGDSVSVNVKMRNDCFLVSPDVTKLTTPPSKDSYVLDFDLTRVEIALLNNATYQSFYIDWFEKHVLSRLNRLPEECFTLKIGFLTSTFNLLFLKLLFEYSLVLREKHHCNLLVELFINNELESGNNFNFKHYVEHKLKQHPNLRINYLNNSLVFSAQAQRGGMYDLDYLIHEPVDVRYGILRKNVMSDLCFIRNNAKNKNLRTFPQSLNLNGMCIESESLMRECQLVTDDNLAIANVSHLQSLSLRDILAEYRTRQQYSLNINNNLRNFRQLSDVQTVLRLCSNDIRPTTKINEIQTFQFQVKSSGDVNALLYWFELVDENNEFFSQIDVSSSGGESSKSNEGGCKIAKSSFSPFAASLIDGANNSNQLAAVCFYQPNNGVDVDKHESIKVEFLFRNDIFHAKSFELLPKL